ncbi:SGT1-domain-containing protein [Rhizoclosmatium globosum]|uniref:SGT1-domain-containing protein n=1 Tax=Rhizoclosmatium globosum TaxID=329046 RepID=A0A1Y2BTS6_9FUNG|nr:SGT1-domain-containing protein [Rhizoclosmatium globosum]|eukprot:ORY38168.1 SGT1-domain-containing protein [Rhizoclosmatium globosum]
MSPTKSKKTRVSEHEDLPFNLNQSNEREEGRRSGIEDCVWYRLYISQTASTDPIDSTSILSLVSSFANSLVKGHIWHKDKFALAVAAGNGESLLEGGTDSQFLYGKTRFGDCIDDEWLVVWMIQSITREFAQFGLVASTSANCIKPVSGIQTARFFLLRLQITCLHGSHHQHQPTASSSTTDHYTLFRFLQLPPNLHSSLQHPKSLSNEPSHHPQHTTLTLASPEIQQSAFKRCTAFPQKLETDGYHYITCVVPRNVARLLKADESLVASAVESFYLRDPILLKPCQTMKKFHPSTNVETSVRFTRTLYAQIASQEFLPPRPFLASFPKTKEDVRWKACDVGMKLAVGFEMIAAALDEFSESMAMEAERPTVETYMFDTDPEYRRFKERLVKLGYFRDYMPGSKAYKELEVEAKTQHLNRLFPPTQTRQDDSDLDLDEETVFSNEESVLARMQRAFLAVPENVPDAELLENRAESSDDWLMIDPDTLEELLKQFGGDLKEEDLSTDDEINDDDDDEDEQDVLQKRAERKEVKNLEKVVKRFGEFVGTKSSVDGVVFPGEQEYLETPNDDDDDFLEAGESEDDSDSDESLQIRDPNAMDDDSDKPLDIDEDKFMKSMIKLLGIDETILRPANSSSTKSKQPSTTTTSSKKQSHTVPKTAPSGFNPSSLLLRPKPTSTAPLVTLDSSDDDTQDLSGSRGVGIVGNRRGVQESEDDSDDEKETVGKWDQAFIRGLESIQRELESRMLNDATLPNQGNDMDAGSESEDTDDDDD